MKQKRMVQLKMHILYVEKFYRRMGTLEFKLFFVTSNISMKSWVSHLKQENSRRLNISNQKWGVISSQQPATTEEPSSSKTC